MYLSRLRLDAKNRNTMRALSEPQLFHGAIERGFFGKRQRNLWRIDPLGNMLYLMVVSAEKPDLSAAAQQFGSPSDAVPWETKEYDPLLSHIVDGSKWHFRLTANPIKHLPGNCAAGERGKIVAHVTPEHQQRWLQEKAPQYGFEVKPDDFLAVSEKRYQFRKGTDNRRLVTLLAVTFEGTLTVTDAEIFRRTLVNGIGRGKAYGMGMLTVVRTANGL